VGREVLEPVVRPRRIAFEFDPLRKDALPRGLDAAGATLQAAEAIRASERGGLARHPGLADR
jgi:3-isopropylmalate dehydratase small subunit